jgi:hypothetical protein
VRKSRYSDEQIAIGGVLGPGRNDGHSSGFTSVTRLMNDTIGRAFIAGEMG